MADGRTVPGAECGVRRVEPSVLKDLLAMCGPTNTGSRVRPRS